MRKLLLVSFLLFLLFTSNSFSQIPPNLMGRDPKLVDSVMKTIGGSFKTKDYTDIGQLMLSYELGYSFTQKMNNQGNSMLMAIFVFGVPNKCTTASYIYADKGFLNKVVEYLDNDDDYIRKQDSFGWKSVKFNYEINIARDDNNFNLTYRWLPKNKSKE